MNLYILRHGKACTRSPKWQPDSTRPLTRDGEKRMFDAAAGIQALDLSFDLILTSPYIRALRTAEIVAEILKSKKMVETKGLVPEEDPQTIIDEFNEHYSNFKQVLLVGHEPHLSTLISTLLSGKDALEINLRKGALCSLTAKRLEDGPCACLEWLMTSRQLARIGKMRRGK
jgi:phosphohistidine phosphatase